MSKALGDNVEKLELADRFAVLEGSTEVEMPFVILPGQNFVTMQMAQSHNVQVDQMRTALVNLFRTLHEETAQANIRGPELLSSRSRAAIDIALSSFNRVSGIREIFIQEIVRGVTGR